MTTRKRSRISSRSKTRKTKKEVKSSVSKTLFVFYAPDVNFKNWGYNLPKSQEWEWIHVGQTKNRLYPKVEKFAGPAKYNQSTRKRLQKKFEELKKQRVITRFKIRSSYLP